MKKWYLTSDGLNDPGDAFLESLEAGIGSAVTMSNHDFSESKEIKCIIQGGTADTLIKSLERTVLVPAGTLSAGMYLFFDSNCWLVAGYPGNNKFYEKAVVRLCQYKIKWQNEDGRIVQRWVHLTSAVKDNSGETVGETMTISTNKYMILIPKDDETMKLEGKRIFIDQDLTNPTKVFKITRIDDSLYVYGAHGGILNLTADKTEWNPETDNRELMICDYIAPAAQPEISAAPEITDHPKPLLISPKITYSSSAVKVGSSYRTFTGSFTNAKGETTHDIGAWTIRCDFLDKLMVIQSGNQLKIKIPDEYTDFIGRTFELVFSNMDHTVSDNVIISVEKFI